MLCPWITHTLQQAPYPSTLTTNYMYGVLGAVLIKDDHVMALSEYKNMHLACEYVFHHTHVDNDRDLCESLAEAVIFET